ncbi:glycoside hydrolase family 97 protein [Lentimicrobium sp. S6]|uniref:glycoside hydrolase family 97 protein n=1 Tax=Lentimicrobium sp. S6 TaxID=2735872 RepID=UPI0015561C65|nr:glycoside hydrolase family 97 protein [Lentimicrobium sp. S6]NPD44799.1 glycoside hydrolase family 97 protein [Lentimicrobium sp. S6]
MKKHNWLIFILLMATLLSNSQSIIQESPDKSYSIEIFIENQVKISVYHGDSELIHDMIIACSVDEYDIDYSKYEIRKEEQITLIVEDPVPVKFAEQEVIYSQLLIEFSNKVQLELLLGDEGFAYRWLFNFKNDIFINDEILEFQLNDKDLVYFPKETTMTSHYERLYVKKELSEIDSKEFCSLPVLFQKQFGNNVFFSEADLYDYPCLFLEKQNESNSFKAIFPKVVLEIEANENGADRNQTITKEANYISATKGKRSLPWRVFGLAKDDKQLAMNNMVYQLSSPLKLEDTKWIKPGKVAWDWWNANNIIGVDFESGINNETYKYYIDFASEYGLEYIILDEGWSKTTTNILECQKDINVEELVKYGQEKNVGIILWTLWGPLDEKMDEAMSLYESWGVKGVKVDFMQRADQYMVNYYERVAQTAAKHHLLVDYHGAFKPAGLRRAYPNVLNYEGLKGLENVKWSKIMTPEHNLTLPFIRMAAGPMDYTPGAMDNAHEEYFNIRWNRPMSMGTRCHQVAMYVIYESPLQMLCDNPSNYYREKESTQFISQIPTTWDETIVLEAKVGSYILMARRNGNNWYLGGMTVEEQEFEIELDFLEKASYQVEIMQDGINSDKNAQDYKHISTSIESSEKIQVKMHKGGGYTAILKKEK